MGQHLTLSRHISPFLTTDNSQMEILGLSECLYFQRQGNFTRGQGSAADVTRSRTPSTRSLFVYNTITKLRNKAKIYTICVPFKPRFPTFIGNSIIKTISLVVNALLPIRHVAETCIRGIFSRPNHTKSGRHTMPSYSV